jgi:hypothetical protein
MKRTNELKDDKIIEASLLIKEEPKLHTVKHHHSGKEKKEKEKRNGGGTPY